MENNKDNTQNTSDNSTITDQPRTDFTEGRSFWRWFFWKKRHGSFSFICIHGIAAFGIYKTLIGNKRDFDPEWTFYGMLVFIGIILSVFWIGTYVNYRQAKRGN